MIKKKPAKLLTTDYLDEKLDKTTEEIIDVMKSLFERQNEKIDTILDVVTTTREDFRTHNIRLNDHDVRIEKLEAKIN